MGIEPEKRLDQIGQVFFVLKQIDDQQAYKGG